MPACSPIPFFRQPIFCFIKPIMFRSEKTRNSTLNSPAPLPGNLMPDLEKYFKEPAALIPKVGAKIMSLADPAKKMSKSHGPESYIALFDSDEIIRRKIKIAVTDSGKEVQYDPKNKPAISNLITIYHLFADQPIKEIEKRYAGKGYADFKKDLAEVIIDYLKPLRQKREKLEKNPDYVKNVLEEGRQRAQKIATATMIEVKKKTGLSN